MATAAASAIAATPAGLVQRLPFDGLAAAGTALAVAPLVACFDEAVTRSAAGGNLWSALASRLRDILTQPSKFFGSTAFQWMWIVYAATYASANGVDSFETTTSIQLGFIATLLVTIVNMSSGIAKDSAYARMFSSGDDDDDKQIKTPFSAFLVWFLRDLVACTFIFALPPIITSAHPKLDEGLAKFMTPILAQYFTTPLHLLGLNMVNMPDEPIGKQIAAVNNDNFFGTVTARQMRIIPPYSIGGLLNGYLLDLGPKGSIEGVKA